MTAYHWLVLIVLLLCAVVGAVVAYRVTLVRRSGVPVIMHRDGGHRWRHGALQYTPDRALFFRLVSLKPGPDLELDRASIVVGERRKPEGADLEFAEEGDLIVRVTGRDPRGQAADLQMCVDSVAYTAFLSWVEACSTESVRARPRRTDNRGER